MDQNTLKDKVAVVTGSARGVGRAIAERYATLGARVVVNYSNDTANAQRTVDGITAAGGTAIAVKADMSSLADIDAMYAQTLDRFGRLDIVVANAGVEQIDTPVLDATEADFDRLFAINSKGSFFTLQKGAKLLADGGRLIYVGSSTTVTAIPGTGLYSASKWAARQMATVLAMELGPRNITVNSILPTAIEGAGVFTELAADDPNRALLADTRPLGGRMGRAEDVADAAEYLAGPLASWVSGQSLLISGGGVM